MNRLAEIEVLLFVAGEEGLTLRNLAEMLELQPTAVKQQLEKLSEKYQADPDSGLALLESSNRFKLVTKKEYAELLRIYAKTPINQTMSRALLETLSIVAYKQPITRMEVEEIRGVQSSGSVQKLTAKRLIEEKGRVDGPGRAILYGTTDYFMDYFGLKSLAELPDIQSMEDELEEDAPFDLFYDRYKQVEGE